MLPVVYPETINAPVPERDVPAAPSLYLVLQKEDGK
jgi:hypothetical protein